MHIIFLTKILGIFAVSLNPIIIQNWIKKNASKVPEQVAERSPISRRPIADQSPTSFSDCHVLILTKLVGDRSATSRRLIGDWSATLPGPGCDWFGRNEVPDQSPTSLQHRRDRSGTLLRPLQLSVAERSQSGCNVCLTGALINNKK